jgi:hypothetical protein
MPQSGETTVAAEAFGKLNPKQNNIVAEKINRKTKSVCFLYSLLMQLHLSNPCLIIGFV